MSILTSVVVGLFCFAFVFVVLFALYFMVVLLSQVFKLSTEKKTLIEDNKIVEKREIAQTNGASEIVKDFVQRDLSPDYNSVASGEVRLRNVDEKDTALIMAIVSDGSGIPISQLYFKSIVYLD